MFQRVGCCPLQSRDADAVRPHQLSRLKKHAIAADCTYRPEKRPSRVATQPRATISLRKVLHFRSAGALGRVAAFASL